MSVDDEAPKPEFVLDQLGHVDPAPGAVWRDRIFVPFFGDTHTDNTELLGHDQKKHGGVSELLAVLTYVVESTRSQLGGELTRVGVTAEELNSLERAIGVLHGSIAFARSLAKVSTPDQFATFLFEFKSRVSALVPGEQLLVPGGWRNMDGGHAVMHCLTRDDEGGYTFTVHNTGKGVEYHPSSVASHPKTKYQTSLQFSHIPAEKISDDGFWYMLFKMQVATSDDHRCEVLYDVLLPALLDCSLGVGIARELERDPRASSLCEFRTAQRAEVNYLKSMKESLRYLLRASGWSAAHVKHLSFLMRRQVIDMTALDLNQVETITPAEAKLLRLACQKLARAANKESETEPKRLEADGLEEVYAQLQWVESQIMSKLVAAESRPLLDMSLTAAWEPFPNFRLFRRSDPVEQFAGFQTTRAGNDLIDFLALPEKSSDIRHFGDVLQALVMCHSLCERLSAKATSAAYFQRIALLQDFFTRLLPRPLPPFRQRKPRTGADGQPLPVAECIYATAIVDYATQLQVLNLLLELAKHYLASSKSVASNRAFEGAHAVTMATIVAVADAVIRIPACDTTSVVTLVLNGTDAKFKPKTKSFASPYDSMQRGQRGMQQAIAGFRSQLGAFGVATGSATGSSDNTRPNRGNLPTVEVIVAPTSSASTSPPAATATDTAAPMSVDAALSIASTSTSPPTTTAATAASSASPPAPIVMDAETAAKVAEAQQLLSAALASFAKSKAAQAEQMSAASQSTVTPLFFTSLQNGRGVEFTELSEKLLLTQPSLAVARGDVLEYFTSQSEVATKAIFNLPTRINCSTFLGKDGPTLELIKVLCQMLGYELNPDPEAEDGKEQTMDDTISFLESATWYLTHPKSPFKEHQPELFIYRDIVAMYHIIVAQTDHRRSIKVHRWTTADATLKWRVKEVNRAKTMIDLNIDLMGEEAVCLDALPIFSAADASAYVTDVHLPSEDDILHCLTLPSFNDVLSEEDSESLLSYLTAPYLRLPLVISFFSTKDRVSVLLNRDVQNLVESVLFEPRGWVTEYDTPPIDQIPAASRAHLGASRGMLLNELMHSPQVMLDSLLQMARLTLDLNTGEYTSTSREIILFVVRLMSRIEAHIVYVLEHIEEVYRNHPAPSADALRRLESCRADLRSFLVGPIRLALIEWEAAASAANDLTSCCVFHAHLALLYRGVRPSEWAVDSVSQVLQHAAFLRTWYSAGLTAEAGGEHDDQVNDDLFKSSSLSMPTRFGMSHIGRGGGMMGRRFGGGDSRGLGDDVEEDSQEDGSSRRRGGRRGRAALTSSEEEAKKADAKSKKGKSVGSVDGDASDADDEDGLTLPGLDEEVAVDELKSRNPGEGKASDLPVLEAPDQEVFETIQYVRRGYVNWLATAEATHVDDVLQGCLAASTRSSNVVSRGWRLISSTPGLWRSQNEDLEVNVHTAELFFKHSTIEPIPNFIAQTADYTLLFGRRPMHCALVAMHDHRYWCRMVGSAYSLKRWDRVEPELIVVNQPTTITAAASTTPDTWVCFVDGTVNSIQSQSCAKCQKRERPRFPHGFQFDHDQFGRMFVPTQMQPHEKWIYDAVEPVLRALFGGRPKMAWELFLPTAITDANAQMVRLLGRDDMRTYREVIVHRSRGVAQIYSLLEHGRRVLRSLDYSSDSRFSLRYLEPNVKDRAFPWEPQVRHAAGKLKPAFWDSSLVITRDRTDADGVTTDETFVPSRFLYGLLPSALLDNFFFWQQADDSFLGYPRSRTEAAWFYKLHVQLIASTPTATADAASSGAAPVEYSAVVTRLKLDPLTIDVDDPRASGTDGAASFELKKQLDANDPLMVAINASKVATLRAEGEYTEAIATEILKRFDYDLAIAQSWIADPANAEEIAALKAADPSTVEAIQAASSSASPFVLSSTSSAHSHHLLLLNLLHATPGTLLHRVGTVLSRIEDLSFILCWSAHSVSRVGEEVAISLIELPRLKLKLQPRVHTNEKGESTVRLYSLDHANMFLSDYRDDLLDVTLEGLDNTILLENNERELFVLVPNSIVHRPNITSEPFSTEIVPERGAASWAKIMDSRFFLYPVHHSHTFLLTPTQSSAVYLILLRLLARQYEAAFQVVQSCEADRPLSGAEEWVLQQLAQAATDFHPNAAAIRLKLSLVILHSQTAYPWRVQDEYKSYLEKLNSVAAICRLSLDEEIYLLKHLKSGAEFEDVEAADAVEDANELDAKPRHLDTPLDNRLIFLAAMSAEEDAEEAANLLSSREAVPLLTRTRSGRKQCYLARPVQRGCRHLWSEVESAVDRFYSDFSFASRTWDAQIEYNRPDQTQTMLGPAIRTINAVWKDTITGLGRKLGFFFLADLLTQQVDICLTDPGNSSSRSLGRLFGRLLFLKSTAWGIRFDLGVHRSYRERSFVPFIVLALLERLSPEVAKTAPKLPWTTNRLEMINGCSVSNQGGQDGPEMSSAARHLESMLQFTQQLVHSPERLNDPRLRVHVADPTETIVVPPTHSLVVAPQPTDFACNQRQIAPFQHEEVILTEDDCRCFSGQLLACIALDRYVRLCRNEARVASTVPFDVSTHADAQTHVAKAMLKRMNDDVKVYAQQMNEGDTPKLACLSDETLARFMQIERETEEAGGHSDAVASEIANAIRELQSLVSDLESVAAVDSAQIPLAVAAIRDLGNEVDFGDDEASDDDATMQDASTDTHLHRMQFLLGRYSDLRPSLTLDYLCGCLLSTHLIDDLRAVNPFLPKNSEAILTSMVQAFLLRVNRLGHIHRCVSMAVEVIALLRGIERKASESRTARTVYHQTMVFKCQALAAALVTKRFCFGPDAFVSPAAGATTTVATAAPGALDFEPRYLVFEFLFNIQLRLQQVKLLHTFLTSNSQVQQLIMGAGKTTVIGPLLALILADGHRLVMQVVPSALLEFSRSVMRSRFTHICVRRVSTFSFDRSVKTIRHVTRLVDKLNAARKSRGIVMTTPESVKALALKLCELTHLLESAPANLTQAAQVRLQIRSEMADQLSRILHMWRAGGLILDEVDLLLHPLKSELNFPILEKQPLDLSPDRWELPIHLIDSIFYAQYQTMSVPFGQSTHAFNVLGEIQRAIERGVQEHAMQTSPHLVLLDAEYYHAHIKTPLAHWLLCWLKSKQHLNVRLSDDDAIEYIVQGPLAVSEECRARVRSLHSAPQRKVLHLSHDWLSSFMPHVMSKINRVSFGLLTENDRQIVDCSSITRLTGAVPFVALDVPSHASEYAQPDVLIGLTVLAYRYEGMRRSDIRRVVSSMQRQLRHQVGPASLRPASVLFDSWVTKGKEFVERMEQKKTFAAEVQMDDASPSPSPSAVRRPLSLTPVVPLPIFQLSDRSQMRALVRRVRHLPDLIHFYLQHQVFPAMMNSHSVKLSASGQELGGSLLFALRYGFSGTPSDLLPLELGSCGYELGSEGNILTTLTNPSIVHAESRDVWSVRQLLTEVANMGAHALIDTGALITGLTNLETAQFLLDHGLPQMDGVVFLDRLDRQMILLRASGTVLPLAQCGIDPSKRFTFYDQVHTTGMDIKQALNAQAVLTLGKDMTFRDYAQGAFRMRGIGKGQTIALYIIPEVRKLIEAEAAATPNPPSSLIASVAAWLTVNSMRSERLQSLQCSLQNMRNVWRKKAFDAILRDTTCTRDDEERRDPRRFWRYQEVQSPEMLHVRRCIHTFREPINFEIEADITDARTFAKVLREEFEHNRDLIADDPQALADVENIEAMAAGTIGTASELQTRALNQEVVQENEQEQEQKKTVEQEEQSQVRFSREDEQQRSWKIYELARFNQAADGAVASSSASSSLASLSLTAASSTSATVKDVHPFYAFNRFSVRDANERDIDLPGHILLSSNYFRAGWQATGQRRLKNVTIVLEWCTQSKGASDADSAADFAPVSILSDAQEASLRTAFKMFADDLDATGRISVALLQRRMRQVGEDLSEEDLHSLGGVRDIGYAEFRQCILRRSADRTDTHGKRFFVCVSLKEAESLRRLIHTGHTLFDVADPTRRVSVGLRLLNGALLDASPSFVSSGAGQQSLALQSLRFINGDMFFSDSQLSVLLRALQQNPTMRRQAFFENLLRCRRRDRRRFHDTPLQSIFMLDDEHSLISFRAKVERVRRSTRSRGIAVQDAFNMFDALGDTFLNTAELAFAIIEYLRLPLRMDDVAQIMQFANKKGDGLLSVDEFSELMRADDEDDATDAGARMSVDASAASPLASVARLTLTSEYERLYAEEEALRLKKQADLEQQLEAAKAEKIARDIERKELEESQARDWKEIQEMRKLSAMEELWSCAICTFKNEPTAHFCTVCESKRPEAVTRGGASSMQDVADNGDGSDGPSFWQCEMCSYNNDQSAASCEICNAKKPAVSRKQNKIVRLWSCPICTRLVTADKDECDVCTSDRDAIRQVAPVAPTGTTDFASLFGSSLIGRDGRPVAVGDLAGKVVALYFAGQEYAPCRAFTTRLASVYASAVAARRPFEVVFVSADRDVDEFSAHFAGMPWLAVKHSDPETRKKLSTLFTVQALPTLVVLDADGTLLTAGGRAEVVRAGEAAVARWCASLAEGDDPANSASDDAAP